MSRMSATPASPSSPLRLLSRSSSSSIDMSGAAREVEDARPGRCRPSACPSRGPRAGVSPIDVSTERPPSIAVTDAPLPRWNTICLSSPSGRPRNARRGLADELVRRAVEAVAADAVGCRPARRRSRRCTPPAAASGGRRCRTPRRAARRGTPRAAATIPARFAGLCSGASTESSSMLISTSGVISVGSKKRAPPCTTRWPTAIGACSVERGAVLRERVEHDGEPGGVVGDRQLARVGRVEDMGAARPSTSPASTRDRGAIADHGVRRAAESLADALDEPGGEHGLGVHVDQLVLERRRAAVDDQHDAHAGCLRPAPGSR